MRLNCIFRLDNYNLFIFKAILRNETNFKVEIYFSFRLNCYVHRDNNLFYRKLRDDRLMNLIYFIISYS